MHAFVRRTDRILIARPRLHSMQRGKNEYVCEQWNNNKNIRLTVHIDRRYKYS